MERIGNHRKYYNNNKNKTKKLYKNPKQTKQLYGGMMNY